MKKVLLVFALAALFLNTACEEEVGHEESAYDARDNETMDDNEVAMDDNENDGASPFEITPQEFVDHVTKDNLKEIEAGQWAAANATTPQVKDYGQMLVAEHSGANNKLKNIAGQKNYTVPSAMDDKQRNDLEDVRKKTGMEAEKAFIEKMVSGHKDAIDYFERAAKELDDQELRSFANETLPKLRTHLQKAQQIEEMLKNKES